MQDFAGKVAVVTGGASGIGRGIAEAAVQAGMRVVLADVEVGALEHAGAELRALGGEVLCVKTDVSKRAAVEALADRVFATFGAVHLLVNNAGVAAGGTAWDATWNDWEWVMGVNLWGVIHGLKVFVPRMLAQNMACHIVNTSSMAGLMAGGFSAPYEVTKHAVVALSESLYLTMQQRKAQVGVSVLCPGMVRTHIDGVERNRPDELKNEPQSLSPQMEAGRAAFSALLAGGMSPALVAAAVFESIRMEQFYIVTHPAWMEAVRLRTDKLVAMENPESPGPVMARLLKLQKGA